MINYKIYTLNPASSYIFKIVPTSGYDKVCFWGCEMWNNARLDVIVEATSGSRASSNVEYMLDGWVGLHNPWLVICDILALNDYSYIKNADYTFEQWRKDLFTIFDLCKESGVPVIAFGTHNPDNLSYPTVNMAKGIADINNIGFIDMLKKKALGDWNFTSADGTHLDNAGNTAYFEEIERIIDNFTPINQ